MVRCVQSGMLIVEASTHIHSSPFTGILATTNYIDSHAKLLILPSISIQRIIAPKELKGMLVEFNVTNFLSFQDSAQISLVKAKNSELEGYLYALIA